MLAEHFLDLACANLPVVNRAIRAHGESPMSEYLKNLLMEPVPSYQERDDLFDVLRRYVSPLLGESLATRLIRDLEACPVVLTSNHLGVEYFSQSIQSSILFSLNALTGRSSATTIPVFSCGNIPLDNLTYPQGLLLYDINPADLAFAPRKLPIFPNRLRRSLVSVAQAFDQGMIINAQKRLHKMICDGHLSHRLESICQILQKDYCSDSVTELRNYSQQAVVLNGLIWKRIFPGTDMVPDMVSLELEKITGMLLEYDLSDPKSLAWCVMFDSALRKNIFEELDGLRGCWNLKKLASRMETMSGKKREIHKGCGTVFFWGIDDLGRRVPLHLEKQTSKRKALRGIDDSGKVWELPYTPKAIMEGLNADKLVPSLFTCFLTISFARCIVCVGGYFQSDYLLMMQRRSISALKKTAGHQNMAHYVAKVPTDRYLSGMLAAMIRCGDDGLLPAGSAEIVAANGMTMDDVEKMLSLTVREAHIAGLFETTPDAIPPKSSPPNWKGMLAKDCFHLLEEKILIK